jgi:hypothetical protein
VTALNTQYIKAVSLVEKLHKTLEWLQHLQSVKMIFYRNRTIVICMNKEQSKEC